MTEDNVKVIIQTVTKNFSYCSNVRIDDTFLTKLGLLAYVTYVDTSSDMMCECYVFLHDKRIVVYEDMEEAINLIKLINEMNDPIYNYKSIPLSILILCLFSFFQIILNCSEIQLPYLIMLACNVALIIYHKRSFKEN